jgi:hypothetical protein
MPKASETKNSWKFSKIYSKVKSDTITREYFLVYWSIGDI